MGEYAALSPARECLGADLLCDHPLARKPQTPAHEALGTAAWLTAVGGVIAVAAWVLLLLSRRGEAKALAYHVGNADISDPPPLVQSIMKKAAIKKLLAFRVMIVSGLSLCVAIYLGLKGLYLL